MKKLILIVTTFSIALLFSCGTNNTSDDKKNSDTDTKKMESKGVNLASKGIPITLDAPEDSEIRKGLMIDDTNVAYEIVKGKFHMEVQMYKEDVSRSIAEYIADEKDIISDENPVFVKEEPNGFIYKTEIDGDEDYDFYYVTVKNNKAIEFRTGIGIDLFTLEDIQKMYEIAKKAR